MYFQQASLTKTGDAGETSSVKREQYDQIFFTDHIYLP